MVVNNVQIPQLPDCVNPVQPRLQDLDGADQEPYQADHLRDNSTDQTDSVVQDEDVFMFTLSLSVSLEAPQVMEESPIHSFSASSEVSCYTTLTRMISLLPSFILDTMALYIRGIVIIP